MHLSVNSFLFSTKSHVITLMSYDCSNSKVEQPGAERHIKTQLHTPPSDPIKCSHPHPVLFTCAELGSTTHIRHHFANKERTRTSTASEHNNFHDGQNALIHWYMIMINHYQRQYASNNSKTITINP